MARPSSTGGKTSKAKASNASPAKGRKTTKTKRRIAPAATRAKSGPASGPSKDLKEAREQQAATAEILKVIASSPDDVQPVFEAIVANADRLIGGFLTAVYRFIDGMCHLVAFTPVNPAADEILKSRFPRPVSGIWHFERAQAGETVEIPDTEIQPDKRLMEIARAHGFRSMLCSPLMSKGTAIGVILVGRRNPGPFSAHHVELLQTFADQALIAIENARLFKEVQDRTSDLSESLQQQTATSEVLQVISSSTGNAQPVFDQMLQKATQVCGAEFGVMGLFDGEMYRRVALYNVPPTFVAASPKEFRPDPDGPIGTTFRTGRVFRVDDLSQSQHYLSRGYPSVIRMVELGGVRTLVVVPMLRDGEPIGVISIYRQEVRPFTDKQIDLLKNFASQAVIAIENTRLFNETSEALERQTATADILKVIASSPSDVQPVFDAIARRANTLIGGFSSTVFRFIDGIAYLEAFTPTTPAADEVLKATFPRPVADYAPFRMAQAGEVAQIADTEASTYQLQNISRARGYRSMLYAPLMSDGMSIGFIAVTRVQPGTFPDHHVQLLRTFADQAVIAISNVELFQEVQNRTKELSEALQFQTAGSDVLRVISRSPDKLQPVLDAIVETSRELCGSDASTIFLFRDGKFYFAAIAGEVPRHLENLRANPMNIDEPGSVLGRLIRQKCTLHYANIMDDPELSRGRGALGGPRALLIAPLMNQGDVIGAIVLRQSHLKPFTERQIQAIEVFADQAVIAISNVGLFEQVQAKTRDLTEALEQQTATSEVLEVISSSPGELQPVFQRMLENATRICGANFGTMSLYENGAFRPVAFYNVPQAYAEKYADTLIRPHPQGPLGTVARTHEMVHVEDTKSLPVYIEGNPAIVAISDLAGARTIVIIPMLRENELIGSIAIYRQEVRPFSEKQISLLANFAKQAVIAIENTRLLKELRQRTDDLSQSLDDLRSAQDRLVQTEKLASLGQLTAGIAHEIKNPLNFVNNFSALSAELADELNDVLKPIALDHKVRGEVDELTGLLKDNLEKVVQHGKRADSIVKNMLLHSREGSREHRPADINSLLDESLNLAYHGARAEKGEFNMTLQRDFDADAGTIELFPQEITRAFLNLIANGVYAATRRKNENKEPGFEPTLQATTKNLGAIVEIRIRDNGTGIPPEVQEKMFNPFFTTKPAGEGTGLGLSMTHDIIVKQHGGRIDVATELGQFTEFTIVLPRNMSGRDRGET